MRMNGNFSWMLFLFNFKPLNTLFLSVKFLAQFLTQVTSFKDFTLLSLFFSFFFSFLLGGFICSLWALFLPKMCSGRLVNCASKALMRGNGEIAHAGIKKLAGPVAQLVIVVHLTAASQSYH